MNNKKNKKNELKIHVINDPVHGAMQFSEDETEWIKPIIDHELFQRLRHIKQLGFADLVYPGAVHTRFSHCLGACFLAKKIFEAIHAPKFAQTDEDQENEQKYKRTVMRAALLHDITHGPFSHAFEGLFSKCKDKKHKEGKEIKHEDWTDKFVNEIFKSENISHTEDAEGIINLIRGLSSKEGLPDYLFDIISSQLDADRLDYLLRDSHFAGVSYGQYNPDWLICCLTLAFPKESKEKRLGITRKGIGVIEHYLLARRFMTLYVYLHKKKCAAEFLLKHLLQLASELASGKSSELKKLHIDEDLLQFLKNTGEYISNEEVKENFIEKNYQYYKKLTDNVIWDFIKKLSNSNMEEIKDISSKLLKRELPTVYSIVPSKHTSLRLLYDEILLKGKEQGDGKWREAIDKPEFQTYKSNSKEIYIFETEEVSTEIKDLSKVIDSITDKSETPVYLYIENTKKKEVKHFLRKLKELNLIDINEEIDPPDE